MNIEIEMENGGIIKAELYPDTAPITVENFVKLIEDNFFDGLIFHRVISGFMIQGGGYTADGQQKEAESIKGEFDKNGVPNPLKHTRGVLSMARTMFPNSASSQFFIMHDDAPHLDGQYAAFGKVTDGMDVVDEIAETATDMSDRPLEDQIIKTIRLV
ncbi:MAG: peptidylprolyl isomerase [Clostridia bacterium]|nr:peptidylprolyl isomerase [Clostridia bacterium]